MTTKHLQIESTLDWRTLGYNVRFWIDRKEYPQGDDAFKEERALMEHLRQLPVTHPKFKPNNATDVLEKMLDLFPIWLPKTRLNAIQVSQGDLGVMVYLVPFDEK